MNKTFVLLRDGSPTPIASGTEIEVLKECIKTGIVRFHAVTHTEGVFEADFVLDDGYTVEERLITQVG